MAAEVVLAGREGAMTAEGKARGMGRRRAAEVKVYRRRGFVRGTGMLRGSRKG